MDLQRLQTLVQENMLNSAELIHIADWLQEAQKGKHGTALAHLIDTEASWLLQLFGDVNPGKTQ